MGILEYVRDILEHKCMEKINVSPLKVLLFDNRAIVFGRVGL